MPTRQQLSTVIDLFVDLLAQTKSAGFLLSEGDQDYYTKRTAELLREAHDQIEEGVGYLRLTQAGLPVDQRVSPGHMATPTVTRRALGGDPSTATTIRPPRGRTSRRGR